MSISMSLIYPALAQILLTFVIMVLMGSARVRALKERQVKISDIALSGDAFPDKARQVANNFTNQFETPVLFFALVLIAIYVGATGRVMAFLAWGFIASRLAHAYVHITSNNVRLRFNVYLAGIAALALMWIIIVIELL